MVKKLNRLSALLMSILLTVLAVSTTAFAAGKIKTDEPVSLTIHYEKSGVTIYNVAFDIYKVADVSEYSEMTLTEVFLKYKDTVSGLSTLEDMEQDTWMELASTLKGYVQRDGVEPVASGKTDSNGDLTFTDIRAGLYLVIGGRRAIGDYTYTVSPFMIFLPGMDFENNVWNYDYDAYVEPKVSRSYNPPEVETISLKVQKKWDDEGYESLRPTEITVELLCDGKVYENGGTQTLSKSNNWRYEWTGLDPNHDWQITEKEVTGYTSTVEYENGVYTVTNKYMVPPVATNEIAIQKRITGEKPEKASTFTFVLKAINDANPMPEGSNGTEKEISVTGSGSKSFGEIKFTKPGKYVYVVTEKNTGEKGYVYDTAVFSVTFEVTEENGELKVTKTIRDVKNNAVNVIEFTNKYKPPIVPQTGMLWWPVPALLITGLIFVMIGVLRRKGSQNEG